MSTEWKRQVRLSLSKEFAQAVQERMDHPVSSLMLDGARQYFLMKPAASRTLMDVLDKHNVVIKNQFEAFSDFCKEAEENGETDTTLYKWTKDVIEKPGKKEHYSTRYTVYTNEGGQIYDEAVANAIEADLQPLVEDGFIVKIDNISADPAKNPQAPAKFRR